MAAALFRRGTGLCVRCIHRELCRLVWRPQTALFSSKPSDRKQPRRTHIKKAKRQPAVDVAKLLEQLFSQHRPGTAPPAARPAKAPSVPSKPPTSNVPPLSKTVSVFPAASSFTQVDHAPKKVTSTFDTAPPSPQSISVPPTNPKTSYSSETPQPSPLDFIQDFAADCVFNGAVPPASTTPASLGSEAAATGGQTSPETIETKVETATVLPISARMQEKNTETSSFSAPTVEALIETSTESPVELSPSPVETLEVRAAAVEASVEPTVEEVQTKGAAPGLVSVSQEPLLATTIESPVEASHFPIEMLETRAAVVEGPVELTVDATLDVAAETKSINSGVVNISHTTTVEPLLETTIEPSVEASTAPLNTLENRAAVAGSVEATIETEVDAAAQAAQTHSRHSGVVNLSYSADKEPLIETIIEPAVEVSISPLESRAAVSEATMEPNMENLENTVEMSSVPPVGAHGASLQMEEQTAEAEAMTLESITLAKVKAEVGGLESGTLLETRNALEKEAEELAKEEKREVETTAEDVSVFEDTTEAEVLMLDSISEATDAIEAETSVILEAMFGSEQGPRQPPDTSPSDQTLGQQDKMMGQEAEKELGGQEGSVLEAMTLESVTLAEVEASVGTLENESLSEMSDYLEKEAEILAGEKKMEAEEGVASEEAAEALRMESLSLPEGDALSEALQADTLMEELLFSIPGHVDATVDAPAQIERTNSTDAGPMNHIAEAEPLIETTREPAVEASTFPLESRAAVSEATMEPVIVNEAADNVKELLRHAADTVETSSVPPVGAHGASLQMEEQTAEAEAMTLESITLAKVKAEVGGLQTEALLQTRNALEKEAEELAKEEKREVETTAEDVSVFEDTTEAEVLTLDSISEATDAIEAETSVILEAMFGSEQGPRQPPDTSPSDQTLGQQDKTMGQEAEKELGGQEGSVLEAMTLESVTLAEVEASVGTLENESLSEMSDYLEKEAEILAGEKKMEAEEGVASEEATEALRMESLSLPEGDAVSEALQADTLMEELLFSIPGHTTEGPIGQEDVRANSLDVTTATVATGSAGDDAAVTDDSPDAQKVVLLGQEAEEETEALGNEGDKGTHADLDPVQRLFLEKIREYNNMRRLNGGPLEAEPDYKKYVSEETAKLQRLYGGGDLSSFPQFTFTDPRLDQDSK
ncbi:uncharacterized abhydrolase domain-containing protein DDB_G0269086-like [Pempheris klunzingeri]|uniref:uncharacterized abhydrolase domain-containing protein DDB_G0269086-like n=1 Tax=Pempheris klunzingeri TaxID=3127111 RepID=UPI003980CEF6